MIICFFGHSDFKESEREKEKVYKAICDFAQGGKVDFYLGDYGKFDDWAYECAKKYKREFENAKLIFVTPYIYSGYHRIEDAKKRFDEIIYPELEITPLAYAIPKRNEWMVEVADYIIFYVNRSWGGAAKALEYALKRKKKFVNLAK